MTIFNVRDDSGQVHRVEARDADHARAIVRRRLETPDRRNMPRTNNPEGFRPMRGAARDLARVAGERSIDDAVRRNAIRRNMQRVGLDNPAALPLAGPAAPLVMGANLLAQPFRNMARSPPRRQNVADSWQGFVDDAQELPRLDWGQVASDTSQSVQRGVRDLPRTAGAIATHLPEIGRAMTYGPLEDEERAMQALDRASLAGDEVGVREAAGMANENTALTGLNVAAPLLFTRPMSVARAAGTAAALDAPFALSRDSDRPVQERLPGALTEIGGTAAFGGGMQAAINAGPALSRILPSRGAQMVQRMDRAGASVDAFGNPIEPRGVSPSFATANNGAGVSSAVTNMVADNIFAGAPSRGRLRQSATQLRDAVHDVRDSYGRPLSREGAGRAVQSGLERYADERGLPNPSPGTDPLRIPTRDMSFPSKAQLVFDQALRPIERNAARLNNTRAELQNLARRADAQEVRDFNADPRMVEFSGIVTELSRGNSITLRDLRELRRGIREAQRRAPVGPDTVDNAALARIESSLTRDIYEAAGPAADRLRQADQFYARGMQRIKQIGRLVDPNNPTSTIQQILRASDPRTENSRFLTTIRSALPDDEWRVVAASIIDEMGAPLPGASGVIAEQGFSVQKFARSYRAMSPRARRILFGSRGGQGGQSGATMRQLADDLDNLAQIADAQSSVAAGANSSGSATHLQNVASIGLLVNPATAAKALLAVLGGVITGEMLTNPGFVRFLVSAQRRSGASGGIRGSLAQLRDLAARDPALLPAVAALESQLQDQRSQTAPRLGDSQGARLQPEEGAYQ